ncbi:MAG: DUF4179 domain-containing protein [Clostridia bacterium]|nr:DUF4179 domain-containing protein [Clostridia bacterium]
MKRITQRDLQQMYEPMPEHFAARMDCLLSGLPEGEETIVVKRKLSVAMVLAMVLLLVSVGAAAAVLNWNAILALYGQEKPELESLLVPVNQSAEAGGVTLEVTSALTDGRTLVLDWTLRANEDVLPVHIQAEELITNGQSHWIQSNGLQVLWLQPEETLHQSCEIFQLEQPVQAGEKIRVELTLRVARPKQEVIILTDPVDASAADLHAEAARLREQGIWAVAPQCLVFAYRFDDNNVLSGWNGTTSGLIPAWNTLEGDNLPADGFDYDRLTLSFDVTVPVCTEQLLYPAQRALPLTGCSLEIIEAVRTPLGVYTTVELVCENPVGEDEMPVLRQLNSYATHLQLGQGEPTVDFWNFTEIPLWKDDEGYLHRQVRANMIGYQNGLSQDDRTLTLRIGEYVYHIPEDGTESHAYYKQLFSVPIHMEDHVDTE